MRGDEGSDKGSNELRKKTKEFYFSPANKLPPSPPPYRYTFEPAPEVNGVPDWSSDPDSVDSCRYCFDGFIVSKLTNEDVILDHVVSNTTRVSKGCNCMGIFPVPEHVCFSEFNYLDAGNPFKCINSNLFTTSLTNYMAVGGNQNWWVDYVYATKDEDNKFERIAMSEVTVQTELDIFATDAWKGMDMVNAWDEWAKEYNQRVEDEGTKDMAKVMVYCASAPKWRQTILLMPAAIQGVILSLALSWIVLVIACENWILASLAILTISMIVTIVFGFLTFSGWGLGLLEGILVVLVIGFSVDYTVHLSDSYKACEDVTRYGKVKFALESTGFSIISGAISTVGAAGIMLTANIAFFEKFGTFIFLTIILSTLFSLGFYAALLASFGPLGMQGRLINIYGGFLTGAKEHMEKEIDKAEREKRAKIEMRGNV